MAVRIANPKYIHRRKILKLQRSIQWDPFRVVLTRPSGFERLKAKGPKRDPPPCRISYVTGGTLNVKHQTFVLSTRQLPARPVSVRILYYVAYVRVFFAKPSFSPTEIQHIQCPC